jgi:uncharacterized YccA/Bax inhibitor family protein
MQTNNPVLSRYDKADAPGFAYTEGRSAFAQASGQAPTATPTQSTSQPATQPAGVPPTNDDTSFQTVTAGGGVRVTLNDVVVKSAIMFGLVVAFAFVGWNLITAVPALMLPIFIGALVLGFVNALKKTVSPALMIVFAVVEGLMLGGISNWYNSYAVVNGWDGIVLQAVVATMTTFGVMLTLYLTGVIKVTKRFTQILMVAAVSYLVLAMASLVASFMGVGGGWGFYGVDGIRHLDLTGRRRHRLVLLGAGLRGDQAGRRNGATGAGVLADGLRAAGHLGVDLPGVPAALRDPFGPRVATARRYGKDRRSSVNTSATAASSDAAVVVSR